jgi:hypothetical protein
MSHCQTDHATSTAVSACARWSNYPYLAWSGATTKTISQDGRLPSRDAGSLSFGILDGPAGRKDGFTSAGTSWTSSRGPVA